MAHEYKIKTSPEGKGEWKATVMKGNTEIDVAYGLSRQEAVDRAIELIPQKDRFEYSIHEAEHTYGYVSSILDRETDEEHISSHQDSSVCITNNEHGMPKQYFKEKYGDAWNWHYTSANPGKGFFLPLFTILTIFGLLMYFFGR